MTTDDRWRRISEIFDRSREMAPAQRAAFLAESCRDDEILRAEVEALLTADHLAQSFGDHPLFVPPPALAPGSTFGAYRIVEWIGGGGMGDVYRAKDLALGRDVAIKILPAHFADDPARLARFDREARLLATLNHPHIAAIYGVANEDGIRGLVLELVEGPTLADRIATGRLPLADALAIAMQIADALEAAHGRGVVHRDLKPANIKITVDDVMKVLDFGLATVMRDESSDDMTSSPVPAVCTVEGMVVGTAAYMSPEQARGRSVDRRADVWAFGCVLYEMLTGRLAFSGDDVSSTLAEVIKSEPDWTALPPDTPPSIRRLLRRCLMKDRLWRLRDIGDARLEIQDALVSSAEPDGQDSKRSGRLWTGGAAASTIAAASLVGALTLALIVRDRPVHQNAQMVRSNILASDGTTIGAPTVVTEGMSLALSPNGQWLVFVASGSDNRSRLWLRSLASGSAEALAGTEGANRPFWSPDSRTIAFFTADDRRLKRVDLADRTVVTICESPELYGGGGTWNANGVILFAEAVIQEGPIYRVAASGGKPAAVTTIDAKLGERRHFAPFFLPDNRHFLYSSASGTGPPSIYVASLDGGEKALVVRNGSQPQYASGRVLFIRGSTLVAQSFDVTRRVVTGEDARIVDGISVDTFARTGDYSASTTDVLVYEPPTAGGTSQLTWFDRAGSTKSVLGEPADYNAVNLSPDGTRAAISLRDANQNLDVWIVDIGRGVRTRLTFDPAAEAIGVWSPDSRFIVFDSDRVAHLRHLFRKTANGSGVEDAIDTGPVSMLPTSWSSDGKYLLSNSAASTPKTGNDLWIKPLDDERKPFVFLQTPFNEGRAQFSFDGRWIAYQSNESGRNEVYVTRFPGPRGKWRVSTAGGGSPRWRRDGRELFYVALDGTLMAAAVRPSESTFDVGAVQALFKPRMRDQFNGTPYDVTADGQRFLINTFVDRPASSLITLVVNWSGLLRQ